MFSFPAILEADFESPTNGKGLRGTKHADGHEGSGKDGLFEADADAGAAFARLLEGAFGCSDTDPEALRRIMSASREAGVDPSDPDQLFQVLESFVPMHADGVAAGGAAASDTGVLIPGAAGKPEDLSDVSERLGRVLAGLAAGSTKAGIPGVKASPGGPAADQSRRGMASEDVGRPGLRAENVDAALARIVAAFSRNSGETQSLERLATNTPESGNPIGEGRAGDGSAMKKAAFGGDAGGLEEARTRFLETAGGGNEKAAIRFRGASAEKQAGLKDSAELPLEGESRKMRAYLDSLADQLTTGGKKGPDGRMGLKMTGFKEGVAGASQQTGESARAQGASGSQTNGAAAPLTGSMSGPLPPMGAETPAFGGDGSFQGAMAESSGGKAAPAAMDAGNPGSPSAAAFDKHLQSPVQALENRVVGQVFMRLFTGAGRGTSSMTVNIHPPELGSVRVRIVSEHGRMSVHLNAQTQQVAGILERNLPALHQSLADQGVDIDDLQVSVGSEERENENFEDRAFTGRPAGNPSSGLDESGDTAADHPPEPGYTEGRGLSLRV